MPSLTCARWATVLRLRPCRAMGRSPLESGRMVRTLYLWTLLEAAACVAPPATESRVQSPRDPTTSDDDSIRANGDGDSRDSNGDGDSRDSGDGDQDIPGNGEACEEQIVRSQGEIPEMLIVLDRSGSMKSIDVNRWDPSVAAVTAVTASLDSRVNFGLMVFPGIVEPTQNCTRVGNSVSCTSQSQSSSNCEPGSLEVPVAPKQAGAIEAALRNMSPLGGTPTTAALAEVGKLWTPQSSDPDAMIKARYVLLVTDGAPNCAEGGGNDDDLVSTVRQIEKLAAQGTRTYVIGYNTQGELKPAMDMMAVAGDTGSTEHIAVENQQSLVQALQTILGKVAYCDFSLDEATKSPSYVSVTIDQTSLLLNDPNGFSVSPDGRKVTVRGTACEQLSTSSAHVVRVKVLCEPAIL